MRMPQAVDPPQGGGRGGGAFTWLLPFYTVGVVGFLLYTLFKVEWIAIEGNRLPVSIIDNVQAEGEQKTEKQKP